MIIVGIDPGVITGFAVWNDVARQLTQVASLKIHEAMRRVLEIKPGLVVFEDARQRNWFGGRDNKQHKFGAGVREGAGSVKRDCTIWEDFLKDHGIPYIACAPAVKSTKWDAKKFKAVTGWTGRTSEHARDATVLVFGRSALQFEVLRQKSAARIETLRRVRATRRRLRMARRRATATPGPKLEFPGDLVVA